MEKNTIYTVGHSTHQLGYFLELLREYNVNCIVDVRSSPASAYNPQYNQEPFKNFLKKNRITYLHFPEEFGARQTDRDLLDEEGILDFVKVRKSWAFNKGLERIWQGVEKGFVIAIMCSEGNPLDCHRFSMVSVGLENDGFAVKHIMKDKSLKEHSELEKELLKEFKKKLPEKDLFNQNVSDEEHKKKQLDIAYRLKNKKIGYQPYSNNNNKEEEYYD